MLRALVVRCRRRQEDPAFPETQLRVGDPPFAVHHPLVFALAETEGTDQPIDRRRGVLVGDHRHNRRHLLPSVLDRSRSLAPEKGGREYLFFSLGSAESSLNRSDRPPRQIPLRTSVIRRILSTIVSREAAYERRRWPSPASPNALPGVTATSVSWRIRSASDALSIRMSTRGKT